MKNLLILSSKKIPLTDAIKAQLSNINIVIAQQLPNNYSDFDLIIALDVNIPGNINVIKSHYSLPYLLQALQALPYSAQAPDLPR